MSHFSWMNFIPGVDHVDSNVAVATAATTSLVISLFSVKAFLSLKKSDQVEPTSKFSVRAIAELLTEFIISLSDMVVGREGRRYVPLFGALFVYILFNNLMGLVPGMVPATDNLNTTLSVGIFSFVMYTFLGIREHKVSYLKQFTGHLPLSLSPLIILVPLMFVIELVSHAVRPMSLGLRLMGNMTGDHTVLGIFTDIFPVGLPIPFYLLGAFVCFIQAFVFTLLSMVYVSMAIAHDDHH